MDSSRPWTVVISCEHARNHVPPRFASLFQGYQSLLDSHRGWDPGAYLLAQVVAQHLAVPLLSTTVTRLLVEPNRSIRHPQLFSEVTRNCPPPVRELLLAKYYFPHRNRVEQTIRDGIAQGHRVFHCGVHTFTPSWDGIIRRADMGLLYDPSRRLERVYCQRWQHALQYHSPPEFARCSPSWQVRKNYPYRGRSDGLTTYLRRLFPANRYLGIELEVNQKWRPTRSWRPLCQFVAETLQQLLVP